MARVGLLDYVAFEKEASYGTEPASLSNFIPVDSFSLNGENAGRTETPISGTRHPLRFPEGNYNLTGSLGMPFYPNEVGWLLYGLFGGVTSTQQGTSSAYQHVFSIENTLPSFTFGADKQGTKFVYLGVKINSATFTFNRADNEVKATFDLIGQKDKIATATFPALTYPSADVLNLANVEIKINDVVNTKIKSFSITVANNINPDNWRTLSSGRFVGETHPEILSVTGSFSGLFDLDVVKTMWGSSTATEPQSTITKVPIEITVTGPEIETGYNYKFHIKLPQVVLTTATSNLATDVVAVDSNFTAIYSPADGTTILADLTNTVTSYA